MGNTVTVGKNIVIVYDSSPGSFDISTYFPDEIMLMGVKMFGTDGDTLIVRNGSSTGEVLSKFSDASGSGIKDSFIRPKWCKPYIYATECTLSSGTVVILEMA